MLPVFLERERLSQAAAHGKMCSIEYQNQADNLIRIQPVCGLHVVLLCINLYSRFSKSIPLEKNLLNL